MITFKQFLETIDHAVVDTIQDRLSIYDYIKQCSIYLSINNLLKISFYCVKTIASKNNQEIIKDIVKLINKFQRKEKISYEEISELNIGLSRISGDLIFGNYQSLLMAMGAILAYLENDIELTKTRAEYSIAEYAATLFLRSCFDRFPENHKENQEWQMLLSLINGLQTRQNIKIQDERIQKGFCNIPIEEISSADIAQIIDIMEESHLINLVKDLKLNLWNRNLLNISAENTQELVNIISTNDTLKEYFKDWICQ